MTDSEIKQSIEEATQIASDYAEASVKAAEAIQTQDFFAAREHLQKADNLSDKLMTIFKHQIK